MRQTHLGELASGPKRTQYGKNAFLKNTLTGSLGCFWILQKTTCASEFFYSDLAIFLSFTVTFETKEQHFLGSGCLNLIRRSLNGHSNKNIILFTLVGSSHLQCTERCCITQGVISTGTTIRLNCKRLMALVQLLVNMFRYRKSCHKGEELK